MHPNNGTKIQELWGSRATLLNNLYDDPRISQLMSSRAGQYLSSHPVFALTALVFGAIAALPVGLFLTFALVTITMSAVGFVFFEVVLLFVGGVSLLCVLSGVALFSVVVSLFFNVFYVAATNVLTRYYPHLVQQGKDGKKERVIPTLKVTQ